MDRILKICFCLIMIGISWIPIADSQSQCKTAGYFDKCQVCSDDKSCPKCGSNLIGVDPHLECGQENRCRCENGYGRKRGDCVQASLIVEYDERCYETNNTLCNNDDFLFCEPQNNSYSRCVCPRSFFEWDAGLKQCVSRSGLIFDVCRTEPDTCDKNAQLKCDKSTNRCLVKKGWKYNCTTNGYEKGIATYNKQCDEESCKSVKAACNPCIPDLNLECQNEVCVCKEGYYWDANETEGKCAKYREYNETCSESIKCNPESNLECNDDKVCDCKDGLFEYDEDENRCVICEEEGWTLEVLIAILVVVYVGVLGEVGLIVWLVRRHRRVHPVDTQQEQQGSSPPEKFKGREDTKSKKRSTPINKEQQGSSPLKEFKGREDTKSKQRSTPINKEQQGSSPSEKSKDTKSEKRPTNQKRNASNKGSQN